MGAGFTAVSGTQDLYMREIDARGPRLLKGATFNQRFAVRQTVGRLVMNILITGGASGVGEAITRRLAGNEANEVWFSYCSSSAQAKSLEQVLPNAHAVHCDFKDASSVAGMLQKMGEISLD